MTNKTEDKFYFLRPGQIARDNDLMRHNRRMLVDAIMRARDVGLIDIPEFEAAVAAMNDRSSIPNQKLANLERALTKAIREEGFSRPGQPERFANTYSGGVKYFDNYARVAAWDNGYAIVFRTESEAKSFILQHHLSVRGAHPMLLNKNWYVRVPENKPNFSRPGQPERFAAPSEDQKQMIRKASKPSSRALSQLRNVVLEYARHATQDPSPLAESDYYRMVRVLEAATRGDRSGVISNGNDSGVRDDIPAEIWYWAGGDVLRWSKPGQPERFGLEDACWEGYEPIGTKQKDGRTVPNCVPKDKNEHPEEFADDTKYPNMGSETRARMRVWINSAFKTAAERNNAERKMEKVYEDDPAYWSRMGWKAVAEYAEVFSRPGQPERFSRIDSMLSDASAYVADGSDEASGILSDLIKERNRGTLSQEQVKQLNNIIREARAMGVFSRPGSPDKFDASSLDRGDFAEASQSPMLGKLLAAKVMPEGGWRAVQVGSDTLVISFEDADLASDFGRRVATKGYNATSPVQAIGRYWNVEVKNDGK